MRLRLCVSRAWRRWAVVWAAVLGIDGPPREAQSAPAYRGSAREAAAAEAGWRTERAARADLTGDGELEDVVVQRGAGGMRLLVLSYAGGDVAEDRSAFRVVHREPVVAAQRVARLEVRAIAADPAPDVIVVFEDPSPDERALTVHIVGWAGGRPRRLLDLRYLRGADEDEPGTVRYGDAAPGFRLADVTGDGALDVVRTLGPQTLEVPGLDGPVRLVIGARQRVLVYDRGDQRFVDRGEERFVDFLPPLVATEVEATRQVPKIWGTAQAFWGADGDLDTAWTVHRGQAVGEALTVRFRSRPKVSMVRVVPGCGGSPGEWARHYRVGQFRIHLSSGVRFELRADGKGPWPAGVRAVGRFPLEGGFGQQLLIFLRDPAPMAWGRFEIVALTRPEAPRSRRVAEACLSEISFH